MKLLKIALALSLSFSILMTGIAYLFLKQKLEQHIVSKTLQIQLEKTTIELVKLRNEMEASKEKEAQ